ncbi:MAG: recombination protein RecR [Gammaproteobacteria bacterium]|nr:recombination protein RecR [Gammaproteobacteria bacterium]
MAQSPLIEQLVVALKCLPGVGPKSAQRIAFHLLERDRDGARTLAGALNRASDEVGNCRCCRTLTEDEFCQLCANTQRDRTLLCIVETPSDVAAVEYTASYNGLYFVLMGHLSPLDGIGVEQLGLPLLADRLDQSEVKEVILATNATVEGEATAHYIAEMARGLGVKTTRLAQGVPMGGELEYVDGGTLTHALNGRREM